MEDLSFYGILPNTLKKILIFNHRPDSFNIIWSDQEIVDGYEVSEASTPWMANERIMLIISDASHSYTAILHPSLNYIADIDISSHGFIKVTEYDVQTADKPILIIKKFEYIEYEAVYPETFPNLFEDEE